MKMKNEVENTIVRSEKYIRLEDEEKTKEE
jgi:hypothetical protein